MVFSSKSNPVVDIMILLKVERLEGMLYLSVPWKSMNYSANIMKTRYFEAFCPEEIKARIIEITKIMIIREFNPYPALISVFVFASLYIYFGMSLVILMNCL